MIGMRIHEDDYEWELDAACRGMTPEFDVPDADEYNGSVLARNRVLNQRHRTARIICGSCPVINQCIQEVLDDEFSHLGVIRAGIIINGNWRSRLGEAARKLDVVA